MRIRTLYFKLLLSFFLVLAVAGIMAFSFARNRDDLSISPWLLAAVALATAALAVPVSRRFAGRIKSLESSVNRIAQGDLEHRVSLHGGDEIKDLGLALNRMATKLERMVRNSKELTANVSHELRRPLTRIRLSVDYLAEELNGPADGDPIRHVEKITADLGEMERLLERALILSRADIKARSLNRVTMDVFDVLAEILDKIQPIIVQKSLRYRSDLPSRIPPLCGDREDLIAALSNILENAVKFAPEKGQVFVKAEVRESELQMEITNSHHPVAEEELARVFDPFYRAASSSVSGSGLGLAIAKKVILAHRGTIEALNVEQGFMIRIRLPLKQD